MYWRKQLTKSFKKYNVKSEEEIDEGVQRILDRLIFIRTSEDRKIEPNILMSIARQCESSGKQLYRQLVKIFRDYDDNYNSKLFIKHSCENWETEDNVLYDIIYGLYETKDGFRYDFSIISSDILGGMYEQYLSYVQGRAVNIDDKQKTKRKSHGIYYTPSYIVNFIVKSTIGKVVNNKPSSSSNIKVLDPACGSGSFLISAYDFLHDKGSSSKKGGSLFYKFDILKDNIFLS